MLKTGKVCIMKARVTKYPDLHSASTYYSFNGDFFEMNDVVIVLNVNSYDRRGRIEVELLTHDGTTGWVSNLGYRYIEEL